MLDTIKKVEIKRLQSECSEVSVRMSRIDLSGRGVSSNHLAFLHKQKQKLEEYIQLLKERIKDLEEEE